MLALLLFVSTALAAPFAEIAVIWEQDGDSWARVAASQQVAIDASIGAERGDELVEGAVVKTQAARVRLAYGDGQQLILGANSTATIQEQGVLQELGRALFEVKGTFTVEHEGVEAAVEGTRFLVEVLPDGTMNVTVRDGVVAVTSPEGMVRVTRGEAVSATATSAPISVPVTAVKALEKTLGPPRSSIGVLISGSYAAESPQLGTRIVARQRLTPALALAVDIGIEGKDKFHFPLAAGLETTAGPVSLGVQSLNLVGQELCPDGTVETKVHPGGAAHVRFQSRLPGPFMVEVQGRGGYSRNLFFDVGVGLSVAR
ncbi:MAG: hypothetical protein GY913_17235 [Proteobacteria bacterium]|nr:hypothetical protein [Pseudomonadota bacterium]MCP4918650.1 hypothetical protein [Pseudomonadota bacterium]